MIIETKFDIGQKVKGLVDKEETILVVTQITPTVFIGDGKVEVSNGYVCECENFEDWYSESELEVAQ